MKTIKQGVNMKHILSIAAISAIMILTGCSDDGTDNNTTNGVLGDYGGDYNSSGVYSDTPVDDGYVNPELGTLVSGGDGEYMETYDIQSFKNWYSLTCSGVFNESLYNPSTGRYSGTIDCSHKDLYDIDLNYLSIFTSIKKIDLSHNHLGTIDFTPLGQMRVINILDVSYNQLDNSIDFSPLYNLESIDELWINNNNIHYTYEERVELYRNLPNSRDDTVKFKPSFK